MPDSINQEVKVALVDSSHSDLKRVENVPLKSSKDKGTLPEGDHGNFVSLALVKQIKSDGKMTNPSKTRIQSYLLEKNRSNSIKSAIKNDNDIISVSLGSHKHYANNEHILSKVFVKKISSFNTDAIIFCGAGNNSKDKFYGNSGTHNIMINNHIAIPVATTYYRKEFYNYFLHVSKKKAIPGTLFNNTPGSSVFIADSGFIFWGTGLKRGTSFSTPYVAGSGGIIACRYLKPRTRGHFPTLVKKYLGYSAKHINQNELLKGWPTKNLTKYMRDVSLNGAEDCNFGLGLGFSYEHGTGEYDPIAFANLCQSHLPAFDIQLLEDKIYSQSVKPSFVKTKQITVEFDCDTQKGYINGVYFAFEGLKETDIKRITLISPCGSRSDLVNDYTSLRSSIKRAKVPDKVIKHINTNRGHSYASNRHFGEKIQGRWKATIETYNAITIDREINCSLDFKCFDQRNSQMIINNNIFTSGRHEFTYENNNAALNYLNLSATSSYNRIDLREGHNFAFLELYYPHPKLRTQHDKKDFFTNLRRTALNPKVVKIKIAPRTIITYVADGMGNGQIIGNEADNTLLGLSGDDSLAGEGGNDHLYPGSSLKEGDKGFGGPGDDTHHLYSYESGIYYALDEERGNNSIVFNISYKKLVKPYISAAPTKHLSFDVDYKRLSFDDVTFYKENDMKYRMQGGNKKVYFNPATIQSVILKHELTGETRIYDRKKIDTLF